MKKLKLNLEDLSVESFAPAALPRGRGTVQGNEQEQAEGEWYELEAEAYARTDRSRFTCPCNFSCLRNCSGLSPELVLAE